VYNEDTDESDDERASSDDDATPKKGTWGKSKTTNGTKEVRATTPWVCRALAFGVWTWDSQCHYLGKQTTRAQLEQEYVFMGWVLSQHSCGPSALGAIHPRHSIVIMVDH